MKSGIVPVRLAPPATIPITVEHVLRRALALVVAGLLCTVAATPAQEPNAPGLDWRLQTLDGRKVTLEELAGRPLVLNMWATWCLPCVAELRSMERLAGSLEDEEVGFVLVSPEARGAVSEWVRRRGYALPFYVEGTRMPEAFGLEAVPTTWVLDAAGRVVLKHRGAADWNRADVRALLRRLAAESHVP